MGAGIVPFAFGTQTGGSTLRPASYNGVAGFKPTFGRVPTAGIGALAPSADHAGISRAPSPTWSCCSRSSIRRSTGPRRAPDARPVRRRLPPRGHARRRTRGVAPHRRAARGRGSLGRSRCAARRTRGGRSGVGRRSCPSKRTRPSGRSSPGRRAARCCTSACNRARESRARHTWRRFASASKFGPPSNGTLETFDAFMVLTAGPTPTRETTGNQQTQMVRSWTIWATRRSACRAASTPTACRSASN